MTKEALAFFRKQERAGYYPSVLGAPEELAAAETSAKRRGWRVVWHRASEDDPAREEAEMFDDADAELYQTGHLDLMEPRLYDKRGRLLAEETPWWITMDADGRALMRSLEAMLAACAIDGKTYMANSPMEGEYLGDEMPKWVQAGAKVKVKTAPWTRKHGIRVHGALSHLDTHASAGEVGTIQPRQGNGWWDWEVQFSRGRRLSLTKRELEDDLKRVKG